MKNALLMRVGFCLLVCVVVCNGTVFAGGFQIYQAASPEAMALGAATVNFELPATDGHIFSLGASRKTGRYELYVGYSYMILEKGKAGQTSLNGVGEFTGADNHFLMLGYSRTF